MPADPLTADVKRSVVLSLLNSRRAVVQALRSLSGHVNGIPPHELKAILDSVAVAADHYGRRVGAPSFLTAAEALLDDFERGAAFAVAYVSDAACSRVEPAPDPYDCPSNEDLLTVMKAKEPSR